MEQKKTTQKRHADALKKMLALIDAKHSKYMQTTEIKNVVTRVETLICKTFHWSTLRHCQSEAIHTYGVLSKNMFIMWPPGNGKSVVFYVQSSSMVGCRLLLCL